MHSVSRRHRTVREEGRRGLRLSPFGVVIAVIVPTGSQGPAVGALCGRGRAAAGGHASPSSTEVTRRTSSRGENGLAT